MIYLAGPYTSEDHHSHIINIGRLMAYHIYLNMLYSEEFIFCPPLETAGYDKGIQEISLQDWLSKSQEALKRCQVVMFTPEWHKSIGCNQELMLADELGIPVSFLGKLPREFMTKIQRHALLISDHNFNAEMVYRYAEVYLLDMEAGRQ